MLLDSQLVWLVFWAVVGFWLTKSMIPVLILMAEKYDLFDDPDDRRKIHRSSVPTLGGIAIFLSFLIGFSFMIAYTGNGVAGHFDGYGFFVAGSLLLFAVGIKDDVLGLAPRKKLYAQLAASTLVILGSGLYFTSMGGIFGIGELPVVVGFLLTLFTMIVIINAYNLIDGIDGLAGSVALLSSLFFGYWFWQAGLIQWAIFSTLLSAAIVGFLWYNLSPAEIFMGDTGSLIVGFFLAVQAVAFVNHGLAVQSVIGWQHAVPVIAMAVLVIPLYDTLRIFLLRISKGRSPFKPDRSHLHHFLLDLGCNHREATYILCLVNIFFIGLAVLFSGMMSNTQLLLALLGVAMLVFPTFGWKSLLLRPLLRDRKIYRTVQNSLRRQGYGISDELVNGTAGEQLSALYSNAGNGKRNGNGNGRHHDVPVNVAESNGGAADSRENTVQKEAEPV